VVVEHLKYPVDLIQGWTAEQRDDFKEFRHVVGDTLKDCCAVVGGQQALQLVYSFLISELQQNPAAASSWQNIEAGLFAIRSMASGIDMNDSVVLPQVMELILSPAFPSHPKVRYTVTLILGRYASWSKNYPAFLQTEIQYIINGFADDEVAAASALALKHLTKACDILLAGSLSSLLDFHAQAAEKLRFEDILEITEAIANLISVLPNDQIIGALRVFCGPLLDQLNQLSQVPVETRPLAAEKIVPLIDRFTILIKHLDPPPTEGSHPLMDILIVAWPIFDRLFDNYVASVEVIERLCRCIKYSIRACRQHFTPLIEHVINRMIAGYKISLFSAYLYASKEIVYQFGSIAKTNSWLINMLSEMSASTFSLLQKHENFVQHPDIVEDYFYYVKEYLEACPLDTVPYLDPLFQCGLAGLTFNHREAVEAVIGFFYRLFVVGKREDNKEKMMPILKSLVDRLGYHLVLALIQGMGGMFPSRCIEDTSDILRDVMLLNPEKTQEWVQASLSQLGTKVGATEKEQFMRDLYHTFRGEVTSKGEGFMRVVKNFSSILRKRKN